MGDCSQKGGLSKNSSSVDLLCYVNVDAYYVVELMLFQRTVLKIFLVAILLFFMIFYSVEKLVSLWKRKAW